MLWAEMVFGIVLVIAITGVVNNHINSKRKAAAKAGDIARVLEQFSALEDHIKNNLERRIANLETILTDEEFELNEKFKNL